MNTLIKFTATWIIALSLAHPLSAQDEEKPLHYQARVQQSKPSGDSSDKRVTGTPLDDATAKELSDSLPELPTAETKSLNRVPTARPKTTATQKLDFQPSRGIEAAQTVPKDLEITRLAPQGDVELASEIYISFNQPMVPLTSHGELDYRELPITITPQPPGAWRWVSPETVVYESKGPFPLATTYDVEVPQGIQAQSGAVLDATHRFQFQTPALAVHSVQVQSNSRRPVIALVFNQKVDFEQITPFVELRVEGQTIAWERLSHETVTDTLYLVDAEKSLPILGIQPSQDLPLDSQGDIVLKAGAPSQEGNQTSTKAFSQNFRALQRFKVTQTESEFSPEREIRIHFSTFLKRPVAKEHIRVEPALADLELGGWGNLLQISGRFQANTQYSISLSADLEDQHGQRLGQQQQLNCQSTRMEPRLFFNRGQVITTLDKGATVPFETINMAEVDIEVRRVTPDDLEYDRDTAKKNLPGEVVFKERVAIQNAKQDTRIQSAVDLEPYLKYGHQFLVRIMPVHGETKLPTKALELKQRYHEGNVQWVQFTDLALDVFYDADTVHAFVSKTDDGSPASGAKVTFIETRKGNPKIQQTDATGYTSFPRYATGGFYLTAEYGGDFCHTPEIFHNNHYGMNQRDWRIFLTADRGIYRPGERVHFKGWARRLVDQKANLSSIKAETPVKLKITDSNEETLYQLETKLNQFGGFDSDFDIPLDLHLGMIAIEAIIDGESTYHSVDLEAFRTPEFDVVIKANQNRYLIGETGRFKTQARYYSGGGLANAPVKMTVRNDYTDFEPLNWNDFNFGYSGGWRSWETKTETTASFDGTTDAHGDFSLDMDFKSVAKPFPISLAIEAQVQDLNFQTWHDSHYSTIHPASYTVGLKPKTRFSKAGSENELDVIVTDLAGNPQAGVDIQIELKHGSWNAKEKAVLYSQEAMFQLTSQNEPIKMTYAAKKGGTYQLIASVHDPKGRQSATLITHWSVAKTRYWGQTDTEKLDVFLDQTSYHTGETANVLVNSPIQGKGTLLLYRGDLLEKVDFDIQDEAFVQLPLPKESLGGAQLITLVRGKDGDGKPIQLEDTLSIDISKDPLKLEIDLQAPDISQPQAQITIQGQVKAPSGSSLSQAEVLLFAVDEAVLDLTDYALEHPLDLFVPEQERSPQFSNFRKAIKDDISLVFDPFDSRLGKFARMESLSMAGASADDAVVTADTPNRKPAMRKDFTPLAFWQASLVTDGSGRFETSFKLPDNLTRYRIMAIAAAGDRFFGTGEARLTVRQPLMVRPSAPRFLNVNDHFEMSVIVQNQSDAAMTVQLISRATNAILKDARTITVPAQDRVSVSIPGQALQPGDVHIQVAAFADDASDAAQITVPTRRPASAEAFAMHGSLLDEATTLQIEAPQDAWSSEGGLQVNLSSSALGSLQDAANYVYDYPYSCTEQHGSRILAALAMLDMQDLYADAFSSLKSTTVIADLIEELSYRQNGYGGIDFWPNSQRSDPYLSAYMALVFAKASAAGFDVPRYVLDRSLAYTSQLESHTEKGYSQKARQVLYALGYRAQKIAGKPQDALLKAAIGEGIESMPMEALAHLLPYLESTSRAEALARINNHISETSDSAHVVTDYQRGEAALMLHSERRCDAILLNSLIEIGESGQLPQKLLKGLLSGRRKGIWANTQENAFALMACASYFKAFEATPPQFQAQAWLGDSGIIDQAITSYGDRPQLTVPMDVLQHEVVTDLTLQRQGQGRMYYSLRLDYVPIDLQQEARNSGFYVTRHYKAINNPDDVVKREDGSWLIKAGSEVEVTVTVTAKSQRDHVALIDPLPAGLESINVERPTGIYCIWRYDNPWNHHNLRNEQSEAFATRLSPGTHSFTYIARATSVGRFTAPPARAEEMYTPDTFGHSRSELVEIR